MGAFVTKSERILKILLRVVGTTALLAIVAVFMPYSWMDAIHRALAIGELPSAPIVGYLARSTSAFYAILGGLLWSVSADLRRYRALLGYLGAALVAFGTVWIGVDVVEGMPSFWTCQEGPIVVAMGSAILVLRRGVPADGGGASADGPSA
ncbi:MAG: hypothetical protein ACYTKD_16225 [Planctomycetota bacterium]|jgi:hypothetical protein